MENVIGVVSGVDALGDEKHRLYIDNESFYLKGAQYPGVGDYVEVNWSYNKVGDKKVVDAWSVETPPKKGGHTPIPWPPVSKEDILKAIWASPALATQPGNQDEIPKIAIKWAEESLVWLKGGTR